MQQRNVTTIDPMLQDPPYPETARPSRRRPRWLLALAILLIVLGIAYLLAQRYTAHLFALAPGTAPPAQDYVTIKPASLIHQHKGRILLVTVSLRTVEPLDYIRDKLNSDIQLVNERALVGTAKPSQLNQIDQVQMETSTQTAVIVSLRRLGYTVTVAGEGAEVAEVEAKSPADGHLRPSDVITAFDGTPITTSEALVTETRKHHPGDSVHLTVVSGTKTRTETVTLGQSPPSQGSPHAFIGISTSTKGKAQLPINVSIDAGQIGGPSAGLAFTLTVMDELVQGDLTGGRRIAATGTIEPDGTVGDVGGVVQKTAAVRKAGAVAFLVPPGEYQDAVKHAGPHLKVIKVATLEQALNALRGLGGDLTDLPPPPPATTG